MEQVAKNLVREEAPKSQLLFERLKMYNNKQVDVLNSIEDKLHHLYNKRTPDKPTGKAEQMDPSDFIAAMSNEIERVDKQNVWLERLYNHICEIV